MDPKINIQAIRKYNPGNLKDEDVIGNFLVRQKTFEVLLNQIVATDPENIPQHHLIIGQRGMGKTTLLKRLEVELRTNNAYNKAFIPLQFPEELYNIDRLSKFWLNTLDVYLDYLDQIGDKQDIKSIEEKINQLTDDKDLISSEAYNLFMDAITKSQKRPVLLVDNLDLVFNGLTNEEQWQLREQMSKSNSPLIVGASAAPFNAVFDYDQAFYDYFKLLSLDPLTYEQFRSFISLLAEGLEDEKTKRDFTSNQSRINVLFRLTGGNIRTAIILFVSLSSGFGKEVSDDLDKLLDEITPIYKARMDELSDQLKLVVDATALYWDPINLGDLREKTQLENSTLSPQIKRLRQMGWIQKVESKRSKGDKYEMTERFFNVWYLMRRSTRRHRKNIIYLSKFLEEFYPGSLLSIADSILKKPLINESENFLCLALAEATKDETKKNKLIEHVLDNKKSIQLNTYELGNIAELGNFMQKEEYEKVESILNERISDDKSNILLRIALGELYQFYIKNFSKAKQVYDDVLRLDSKSTLAWNNLGVLNQFNFKDINKAKIAYDKAINADPNNVFAWNNLGVIYKKFHGEHYKAFEAYNKSISLDPSFTPAWCNLGNLYATLGETDKASEAFNEAININENTENAWIGLGSLYISKDNIISRKCFEKVVNINPKNSITWNILGDLYYNNFKEFELAKKAFENAIKHNSKYLEPWIGLGNLYQFHENKYDQAKFAYNKAIEIDPLSTLAWNSLGILYHSKFNDYDEAIRIFNKSISINPNFPNTWFNLGHIYLIHKNNYKEALNSYKKGLEIDSNYAPIWINIAGIYTKYLKDFGQAENALRKAIGLDPSDAYLFLALANIYHHEYKRYDDSKDLYKKSIELNPNDAYAWNGLGSLCYIHYKEYEKAKEYFEKAIKIDPKFSHPWNNLGLIYFEQDGNFEKAKNSFEKAMHLLPKNSASWLNAIFLERDIFGDIQKARNLFNNLSISPGDEFMDTYYLQDSLFQIYDLNFGNATDSLIKAIYMLDNAFPHLTFDDWKRYAAVAIKKGFGAQLLRVFEEKDVKIFIRPYYEACKAFQENDFESLSEIAAEVRDVAKEIYQYFETYSRHLK